MTMILGVGNTLLKDEGLGIHLLDYLKTHNPQWLSDGQIEMIDGGTLSFDLLSSIQADQDLLILDAVNLQEPPGTVYCFQDEAVDEFLSKPGKSVHEVSLLDLFDMSRLVDQLPKNRALIGIQPEVIDWGSELTPIVYQALAEAEEQVKCILQQWSKRADSHRENAA
ncbi:MAG: hydrogenase maturation protease [Gammaproteobacteria bacterium]|nr:hydrogenase maturation protease [Gammaproteobacteria bacterium]